MAKTWDEKLANLSVKLDELSKKAAEASEDAKVYRELRTEAIQDKINTAKGQCHQCKKNGRLLAFARPCNDCVRAVRSIPGAAAAQMIA